MATFTSLPVQTQKGFFHHGISTDHYIASSHAVCPPVKRKPDEDIGTTSRKTRRVTIENEPVLKVSKNRALKERRWSNLQSPPSSSHEPVQRRATTPDYLAGRNRCLGSGRVPSLRTPPSSPPFNVQREIDAIENWYDDFDFSPFLSADHDHGESTDESVEQLPGYWNPLADLDGNSRKTVVKENSRTPTFMSLVLNPETLEDVSFSNSPPASEDDVLTADGTTSLSNDAPMKGVKKTIVTVQSYHRDDGLLSTKMTDFRAGNRSPASIQRHPPSHSHPSPTVVSKPQDSTPLLDPSPRSPMSRRDSLKGERDQRPKQGTFHHHIPEAPRQNYTELTTNRPKIETRNPPSPQATQHISSPPAAISNHIINSPSSAAARQEPNPTSQPPTPKTSSPTPPSPSHLPPFKIHAHRTLPTAQYLIEHADLPSEPCWRWVPQCQIANQAPLLVASYHRALSLRSSRSYGHNHVKNSKKNNSSSSNKEITAEAIYIPERILRKQRRASVLCYHVQWAGFERADERTWEPCARLKVDVPELVRRFEEGRRRGRKSKR